ncbi:MAG: hypothetical protein CL963_00580 [Euryarchaeota archaeon]|jgi:myo-inositol-1(or 4)-monophosphatase|nr:hypothetical protein [Euryarchaeota archaeon]HIK01346.1 inositol monophosphatase [Candidatus Undinarchaeales archaeon ERR594346 U_76725]|tara:strand:+ start:56633 stop:57409 length:777 start_codon:yes stop_codon:yes gene_type:complete
MNWEKTLSEIGEKAGEVLKSYYLTEEGRKEIMLGAGGDMAMLADIEAEKSIIESFNSVGKFSIFTEEQGRIEIDEPEYYAVIDPLDGSFNFKKGVGYFSVSLGILDLDFKPLAGYVYNVVSGDTFFASEKGAFKNGNKIKGNSSTELKASLLHRAPDSSQAERDKVSKICMSTKNYRTYGSLALEFCKVADGSFDFLMHAGTPRLIDVSACIYICRQAGCSVSDFENKDFDFENLQVNTSNLLVSANAQLHSLVLDKL